MSQTPNCKPRYAADIASAALRRSLFQPWARRSRLESSTLFIGASGGSNFAVLAVTQEAQESSTYPKNQVFYLSVTGTATTNPDTISVLDPATATVTSSQPAGVNPNVLAISDDSQFLYAGWTGQPPSSDSPCPASRRISAMHSAQVPSALILP